MPGFDLSFHYKLWILLAATAVCRSTYWVVHWPHWPPKSIACDALWSSQWLPTLPSSKVKQSDWPLKLKAPRSFETSTTTHPHGVTFQKTWILSHAAVITSNVALRKAFFIWQHIPRTLKKYPNAYTKRQDADGMTTQLASASSNIAVQTQLVAKLGTFETTPRKFTGSMNASAPTAVWCCRTIDVAAPASICAFQPQLTQSRYKNCFVRPLQASCQYTVRSNKCSCKCVSLLCWTIWHLSSRSACGPGTTSVFLDGYTLPVSKPQTGSDIGVQLTLLTPIIYNFMAHVRMWQIHSVKYHCYWDDFHENRAL